ncbi:uncharacterized protein [Littorina saxatilis]|uniref:Uncharacterized protein n=1 Tax=Littorina saxatilis TaxID=31220 RepID=A0AAN9BHC6_9CAEN
MKTHCGPCCLMGLLFFAMSRTVSGQHEITCETPGTVTEGDPAYVTCNYNLDLYTERQDFYVYRFQDDGSLPVVISICSCEVADWKCDVDSAYGLQAKTISNEVTLEIERAQRVHAGGYFCKVFSNATLVYHNCSLGVKSRDEMNSTDDTIVPSSLLFYAVPAGVTMLFLVALAIFALIRRHRTSLAACPGETEGQLKAHLVDTDYLTQTA